MLKGLVAACLAGPSAASAQSVEDARADIRSTYDFDPTSMPFDEQARRAPSLSALWERCSKMPEVYLHALRAELRATGNRELLYCDGGMLLLNKSRDSQDQTLGLSSLRKCSLAEIQHTPYFYTLHALAVRGVDTFDLQSRILAKPDFSVFIVQHALSLAQDYAFLYPLLVQDESAYVPRLIARLRDDNVAAAQKSLVLALWYAATPEAEAAVRTYATEPEASAAAKDQARKLVERLESVLRWTPDDATLQRIRSAVGVSAGVSEAELRSKRRARMKSISDEALHDLEAYTVLIYRARRGM